MSDIDVTIVTINYNNLAGLKKTMLSVQHVLTERIEWIVVDGGSVDGSVELIRETKEVSRFISEEDKGIYDAMNKGVKMSTGKYIIFMNSGDEFSWLFSFDSLPSSLDADTVFYSDCFRSVGDIYFLDRVKDKTNKWWLNGTPCHQSIILPKLFLLEYPFSLKHKMYADTENMVNAFNVLPIHKKIPVPISIYEVGGISSKAVKSFASCKRKSQESAETYGAVWTPFSKKFINSVIKHYLLHILGVKRYYIASYAIKAFLRAHDEKNCI
ncbi:glycosyltransferase [Citrobacter telavivensis]